MRKRPSLKVGDVVLPSKRAGYRIKFLGKMTVVEVSSDTTDGKSRITVSYNINQNIKIATAHRKELWYTGYNISDKGKSFSVKKGKVVGSNSSIVVQTPTTKKDKFQCFCGQDADRGSKCWWCGTQN